MKTFTNALYSPAATPVAIEIQGGGHLKIISKKFTNPIRQLTGGILFLPKGFIQKPLETFRAPLVNPKIPKGIFRKTMVTLQTTLVTFFKTNIPFQIPRGISQEPLGISRNPKGIFHKPIGILKNTKGIFNSSSVISYK